MQDSSDILYSQQSFPAPPRESQGFPMSDRYMTPPACSGSSPGSPDQLDVPGNPPKEAAQEASWSTDRDLQIASLLLADDEVLLISSDRDLQHTLNQSEREYLQV